MAVHLTLDMPPCMSSAAFQYLSLLFFLSRYEALVREGSHTLPITSLPWSYY